MVKHGRGCYIMYTTMQKPAYVPSDPRLYSRNAQVAFPNKSCTDLEPPGWQETPTFHSEMWRA